MTPESRRHVGLVTQSATALFAGAAAFGWMGLRPGIRGDFLTTVVLMAVPASSTLLFVVAALMVPSLVPTRTIAFPLNLTLPCVFAAMTLVSVVLWTTSGTASFAVPDALQVAYAWTRAAALGGVFVAQMVTLTVLALLQRDRSRSN